MKAAMVIGIIIFDVGMAYGSDGALLKCNSPKFADSVYVDVDYKSLSGIIHDIRSPFSGQRYKIVLSGRGIDFQTDEDDTLPLLIGKPYLDRETGRLELKQSNGMRWGRGYTCEKDEKIPQPALGRFGDNLSIECTFLSDQKNDKNDEAIYPLSLKPAKDANGNGDLTGILTFDSKKRSVTLASPSMLGSNNLYGTIVSINECLIKMDLDLKAGTNYILNLCSGIAWLRDSSVTIKGANISRSWVYSPFAICKITDKKATGGLKF